MTWLLAALVAWMLVVGAGWLIASDRADDWRRRVADRADAFARPVARLVAFTFFFSLAVSAIVTARVGEPLPVIHDEQSRLLQSQTFMEGRLTNPPHALSDHFEAIHVLQHPTYTSKYPPADAALIALGWKLTGHPVTGSWLAVALGCAAAAWMLAGMLEPRWALVGSVLVALHPTVLIWSQTFIGGGAPLAGGALVVGGVHRLASRVNVRDAVIASVGMGILANSRPYEGLVLSVMAFAVLFVTLARRSETSIRTFVTRIVVPVAISMSLVGGWMAYYNYRVTGHPTEMPYQLYERDRGLTHTFFWLPPNDHVRVFDSSTANFLKWEKMQYGRLQTLDGIVRDFREKVETYFGAAFLVTPDFKLAPDPGTGWPGAFFRFTGAVFPFALAFPLVAFPWFVRRRPVGRIAIWGLMVFTVALLQPVWWQRHYAAPVGGLVIFLIVGCLQTLAEGSHGGRVAAMAVFVMFAVTLSSFGFLGRIDTPFLRAATARRNLALELKSRPGDDLVLVHYSPEHNPHVEVVYNDADIDASPIVWARSLGKEKDEALRRYYPNRNCWSIYPDERPPRVQLDRAIVARE